MSGMNVTIGAHVYRVTTEAEIAQLSEHADHVFGDYADAECDLCIALAIEADASGAADAVPVLISRGDE